MLNVNICIVPFGVKEDAYTLCKILIANVKSGGYFCNYAYHINEEAPLTGEPIKHSGILRDYDRRAPVVDILHAVLEAYKSKSSSLANNQYEKDVIVHLEELAVV